MFKAAFKSIALSILKGAGKVAVFLSGHPEVVKTAEAIALAAGAPAPVVTAVDGYAQKAGVIVNAVEAAKSANPPAQS